MMLDNQISDMLNSMVDKMNSTIKRVFLGSAQALEVGRQVAPEIQSWANAKRLGALAEQTRSKTLLNVEQVAGLDMAGAPVPKI